MRRNFISPEYTYNQVFGTNNMEEESSFFGSKMMEIEDMLEIKSDSIVYYQNSNSEQLDLEREYDFPSVIYNIVDDKKNNHTLVLDDFQSKNQSDNFAKWIMTINVRDLLKNYLFATLKKERSFEGVLNSMSINKNVDFAIKDYIEKNILNRYKFTQLELYISPNSLLNVENLKYKNIWDEKIEQPQYKFIQFASEIDNNFRNMKVFFSQNFSSNFYSFKYYFNLKFEKL